MGLLRDVIAQLSAQQNGLVKHFKSHIIVDVLCDMVAHPSNHVRSCIVSLFNVVVGKFILKIVVLTFIEIPTTKSAVLAEKILPALIALSNDPDFLVRYDCIEPLATIAVNSPNDEVR